MEMGRWISYKRGTRPGTEQPAAPVESRSTTHHDIVNHDGGDDQGDGDDYDDDAITIMTKVIAMVLVYQGSLSIGIDVLYYLSCREMRRKSTSLLCDTSLPVFPR